MGVKKSYVKTAAVIISIQAFLLPLLFTFSNCSEVDHAGSENIKSLEFGDCSLQDAKMLFALTYAPILQRKCSTCHIEGKSGKGVFASSNIELAYADFSLVGYRRISSYAVDSNHNSPYSGPQNSPEISEAKTLWLLGQRELKNCTGEVIPEFVDDLWINTRTYSFSKAIQPEIAGNSVSTVTWDLNTEIFIDNAKFPWPTMPGAQFAVDVTVNYIGSTPSYTILRPRIIYPNSNSAAVDLHIESLRFRLNGNDIINETTFHYVKADARKNETTYLSAGAMVALGDIRQSDLISVSFGQIDVITMPPPPPKVSAQFVSTTSSAVEGSGGYFTNVNVTLQLSQAIDNYATATISLNNTSTATRPCCNTISRDDSKTVQVKRFDRDYVVPGNYFESPTIEFQVQFLPNTLTQNFTFQIVNDDRRESDETIVFDLVSVDLGDDSGLLGTNKSHSFVIKDNADPAPVAGEVTFAQLMNPAGAFGNYCVKCHHADSRDLLYRQFDMTGFTDFKSPIKPLVIAGDPNHSIIYGRVNGEFPVGSGSPIDPMPQGGGLTSDSNAINSIYNWIYYGAKNN